MAGIIGLANTALLAGGKGGGGSRCECVWCTLFRLLGSFFGFGRNRLQEGNSSWYIKRIDGKNHEVQIRITKKFTKEKAEQILDDFLKLEDENNALHFFGESFEELAGVKVRILYHMDQNLYRILKMYPWS